MKLTQFDYKLPEELIAQYPLKKRDASRMLVLDKTTGEITHSHFNKLPDFLHKNHAMVINDTKVFKARLIGNRIGYTGKIEVLILKKHTKDGAFECLTKPSKKLKIGTELEFLGNGLGAKIVDIKDNFRIVEFNKNSLKEICACGFLPLPPYINRNPEALDDDAYQTIYAKTSGAVAAPTAGLHFTQDIIKTITKKGTGISNITLHVGYGTFEPVKNTDIKKHRMHSEWFEISKKTAEEINKAKQKNAKILAVGTTTCRALESSVGAVSDREYSQPGGCSYQVKNVKGETDIFIYPGYKFKITNMLLTNFHLPKTTLLMLVSAFGGYENIMNAYKQAVKEKYRFYSYGDCMLIK